MAPGTAAYVLRAHATCLQAVRWQDGEKLGRLQPCTTFEELWGALQAARAEITSANLHNLAESMPRRLADWIDKSGAIVRF